MIPFENVTEYLSRIGSCETSSGCIFTHHPGAVIPSSLVWVQWHAMMQMDGRELKEAAAKNPLYIHFCLLYSLLLGRAGLVEAVESYRL